MPVPWIYQFLCSFSMCGLSITSLLLEVCPFLINKKMRKRLYSFAFANQEYIIEIFSLHLRNILYFQGVPNAFQGCDRYVWIFFMFLSYFVSSYDPMAFICITLMQDISAQMDGHLAAYIFKCLLWEILMKFWISNFQVNFEKHTFEISATASWGQWVKTNSCSVSLSK